MATLAARDTSGTLTTAAGETEVLRTRTFKRWRLADTPDGRKRFRVGGSIGPVHYQADPFTGGDWNEIDLDLIATPGLGWDYACESNGYQIRVWNTRTVAGKVFRYAAQFRRGGRWLAMAPRWLGYVNGAGNRQQIGVPAAGIVPIIDNEANFIRWSNCFGTGLDFQYNLAPDKFFKALRINAKANLPAPTIALAGLRLVLVMAVAWDGAASASNGFALDNQPTEFADANAFGAVDELLDNPDRFGHDDERGRLWWLQQPEAWDSSEEQQRQAVTWRFVRRGGGVFALFSVPAAWLNGATYPVLMDTAITEEQVGASANNAQIDDSEGEYGFTTTGNIYLAYFSFIARHGWFRFTTVPIPQGATVDSAIVSLCAAANLSGIARSKAKVENVDSATQFSDGATFVGATWTSGIAWSYGSWTSGTWYDSPDIDTQVQSVVNRAGWSEGAVGIGLFNDLNSSYRYCYGYGTDSSKAAKFNASYTAAATGHPARKRWGGVPYGSPIRGVW